MKIYIMRHGEAQHFASSDPERELTQRGVEASVSVAKNCTQQGIVRFDKVLVSPYIRAQQTWQAISSCFHSDSVETNSDITPYGESSSLFDYLLALAEVENLESLLIVSHLPLVGYLTAEFVSSIAPPMFPTSGLVCIDYDRSSNQGSIVWKIHP